MTRPARLGFQYALIGVAVFGLLGLLKTVDTVSCTINPFQWCCVCPSCCIGGGPAKPTPTPTPQPPRGPKA